MALSIPFRHAAVIDADAAGSLQLKRRGNETRERNEGSRKQAINTNSMQCLRLTPQTLIRAHYLCGRGYQTQTKLFICIQPNRTAK